MNFALQVIVIHRLERESGALAGLKRLYSISKSSCTTKLGFGKVLEVCDWHDDLIYLDPVSLRGREVVVSIC